MSSFKHGRSCFVLVLKENRPECILTCFIQQKSEHTIFSENAAESLASGAVAKNGQGSIASDREKWSLLDEGLSGGIFDDMHDVCLPGISSEFEVSL